VLLSCCFTWIVPAFRLTCKLIAQCPFLLQCNNYCNSRGCTGYFVTREGHCSHCPEGAASCSDLTGEVRECRSGLGLVGGECRPCKVDGCQKCDGEGPGRPAMRVAIQPPLRRRSSARVHPTALTMIFTALFHSPVSQPCLCR